MKLERHLNKYMPGWLAEATEQQKVSCEIKMVELLFYDEETKFGSYIVADGDKSYFRIAGNFPYELKPGQQYVIDGKVSTYRNIKQITIYSIYVAQPESKEGTILLLQSLDGLDKRALLLYEQYGSGILTILVEDPLRIAREVSGISERQVLAWNAQLKLIGGNFDLLAKLQGWGISLNNGKKLIAELGYQVDSIIEENPYLLLKRIRGYGFRRCDLIAMQVGLDMRARTRIIAAISYVLREASYQGHCYLMLEELVERTKKSLDIRQCEQYPSGLSFERNEINAVIAQFVQRNKLVEQQSRIYLADLYYAELKVAAQILKIQLHPAIKLVDDTAEVREIISAKNVHLEAKQLEAVQLFTEQTGGMYILNGSAGCGKTFTLNVILDVLEAQYSKKNLAFTVNIFAPTGKAAKVAAKATGRICTTIHRGLKFNPEKGFEFNEEHPLPIDCLVLDESSMLDIKLAKQLFSAIPPHCKVIFMGDTQQLPSVFAGNVLHDLILSEVISVVTLNVIKRQGEDSGIVRNASRIIAGEPISSTEQTSDAFVLQASNARAGQQLLLRSVKRLLEQNKFNLDEIQVLSPQRKGEIGTHVINWLMQQTFNSNLDGMKVENCKIDKVIDEQGTMEQIPLYFIKGDKVIHTVNNYSKRWYIKNDRGNYEPHPELIGITNGECGVIEEIKMDIAVEGEELTNEPVVIVKYEDGYVFYHDGLDELDHCYAMTIHKSQGSQWPAVIMLTMQEHIQMLSNQIFYTGYTRAQHFVCVIGEQRAIHYAIDTRNQTVRNTSLAEKFHL